MSLPEDGAAIAAREADRLERAVHALVCGATGGEVLRALLEGSRAAAPRAALFVVRQGRLRGWGRAGYPGPPGGRLGDVVLTESGWTEDLSAGAARLTVAVGDESWPDLGQPVAAERIALPIRAGGRLLAAILAERGPGELPWNPAALGVLALVASVRMDLDLAQRRLAAVDQPALVHPPVEPEPAPARGRPPAEPPRAPRREESGLAMVEPQPHAPARREDARRYARLIATDIRLYNEEAVLLGRRNGDLAPRLADQIETGRQTFLRRYPDLGHEGDRLLREACVQVLAAGDEALLPPSLFGRTAP